MIKVISHKVSPKNCFESCVVVHYQTREVGYIKILINCKDLIHYQIVL